MSLQSAWSSPRFPTPFPLSIPILSLRCMSLPLLLNFPASYLSQNSESRKANKPVCYWYRFFLSTPNLPIGSPDDGEISSRRMNASDPHPSFYYTDGSATFFARTVGWGVLIIGDQSPQTLQRPSGSGASRPTNTPVKEVRSIML